MRGGLQNAVISAMTALCCAWPVPSRAQPATPLDLVELERLTEPHGYLDPSWSTDGRNLSFSGPRYHGIFAIPADGGPVERLAGDDIPSFRQRWLGSGQLLVPQRPHKPALLVSSGIAVEDGDRGEPVFAMRDDIYVRHSRGDRRLTHGNDRFFDPVLSPDGAQAAFVGLETGIWIASVEGDDLRCLGPGTHPTWSPDGRWLLYERTDDDGHQITDSDLMAHAVDSTTTLQLTDTPDAIEMHPSVSPDGTRLAFVRDGAIWIGGLTL